MKNIVFKSIFLVVIISVCGVFAFGQRSKKERRTAEERVNKASDVIDEIMGAGDKSIPRDLLAKAKAVVVFPGALKLSFIIGGQGGSGIAIKRLKDGWSAPGFINMSGGSFGPQFGGQKTDYILCPAGGTAIHSASYACRHSGHGWIGC